MHCATRTDGMDRSTAEALLRKAVGISNASFHPDQWEAVEALVGRRSRILVVQRTGWGKSLVYFLATKALRDQGRGPTIIISPLLALMRNQLRAAGRLGLSATTINSANRDDWPAIKEQVRSGGADLLLISPERLSNEEFVEEVLIPVAGSVGLLVIDEAHCISDWGHDFRPDYRRILNVLRQMPRNMPILATTATANVRVVNDLAEQLGDVEAIRGSLVRESLALQAIRLPDQPARLAWLAENLPHLPGTGIVYTLTKRDSETVARWLQENGIEAFAYHSSVNHEEFDDSSTYRCELEDRLLGNDVKALVATSALGMGYDKPDLGFVVHYQAPGSVVAYYQQVGRAGRAIAHAYGVLLSGREDADIHDFFRRTAFPDEIHIQEILVALEESDGLTRRELEKEVNLRPSQIDHVLKLISVENPAPVIKQGGRWYRTPVPFELDHDRIEFLTTQRESEWGEIQSYLDHKGCLMRFLQEALDDPSSADCGRCVQCSPVLSLPSDVSRELAVAAADFLHHSEMPLKLKVQVANGAFEAYGYSGNLPTDLRGEEGRILSRWADAGWGSLVAEGKQVGHFDDLLVSAVSNMIRDRWMPEPPPSWLTCVPSLRHPRLVPDLARRIADQLGIPFLPLVTKVRENQPQKNMNNRFHQCANLDGVFSINGHPPGKPGILLDDVVDSGWTLTVVVALLREAGSGPVYPVALASTGGG